LKKQNNEDFLKQLNLKELVKSLQHAKAFLCLVFLRRNGFCRFMNSNKEKSELINFSGVSGFSKPDLSLRWHVNRER
jgi:hypothetical protein